MFRQLHGRHFRFEMCLHRPWKSGPFSEIAKKLESALVVVLRGKLIGNRKGHTGACYRTDLHKEQISYPGARESERRSFFGSFIHAFGKGTHMSSHQRSILLGIVGSASLMLLGAQQVRADMTYYLVDYPLDQGGHHLSGTITTDGTLGDLGVDPFPAGYYNFRPQFGGHITGATFQIDNDPVYTVPAGNIPNAFAEVKATATQIMIVPGNTSAFQLLYNVPSVGVWGIGWQNTGSNVGPYSGSDQASGNPGTVWNTASTSSASGHLGANSAWVIATSTAPVPEPATLGVLATAVVGSDGFRRRRGR